MEPYKWDDTDITKWPVSIAHLKNLCNLWLLTMFAVRMTCDGIFYHRLSFLELSCFNSDRFLLDMLFQSCALGYIVFPPLCPLSSETTVQLHHQLETENTRADHVSISVTD